MLFRIYDQNWDRISEKFDFSFVIFRWGAKKIRNLPKRLFGLTLVTSFIINAILELITRAGLFKARFR